ncbi:MAG TPA: mannosyltransferase family protein [Thermoleophilia bacterium]|nr:mannosyltransferase family protein [Thermoleophilia bacterium]
MPPSAWVLAVGSRVALFIAVYLSAVYLHHRPRTGGLVYEPADRLHGWLGPLVNPWTNWDGEWYLRIAASGYRRGVETAFFPLYPMVVRWVGYLDGHATAVAGIGVSLGFFFAASVALYRLVVADFGRRVAWLSVACLSLFPTSFFFQAVYTESAFLFFTVACVLAARRRRWLLAGVAGFFATLTRNTGLLVLVPMLVFYLEDRDWRLWRVDRRLAAFALVPSGLLVWMAFLWVRFGHPLEFAAAQSRWHRSFTAPWNTLADGVPAAIAGVDHLVRHGVDQVFVPAGAALPVGSDFGLRGLPNVLALLVLVLAVVVVALTARRLGLAYTLYAAAALVAPLFYPTPRQPLYSMPRFVLAVFPLFIGLGILTERRRWLAVPLLVVSAATMLLLASFFARFVFVA